MTQGENEEEPDISEYITEKDHQNEIFAPTKSESLITNGKVLNSPSYEYDTSYILQETEEEPDVIEFIEEKEATKEN